MMTTMLCGAEWGTLPIARGGLKARAPKLAGQLGLAVVGGLVVSQLLTLYITPVVYIYMERVQGIFGNRKRRKPTVHEMPEPAGALGD